LTIKPAYMPKWRTLKSWGSAYLFILPAVSFFILFMYVPIFRGLTLSLQEWSLTGTEWLGLDNYRAVLADDAFYRALWVTVKFTVLTVIPGLVIALFVSMMIDPLSGRTQAFFKAAYYLPNVAPIVIISIIWSWLFNPAFGLLNYLLSLVHIGPVLWLGDPDIAIYSIIGMTLATGQGASILILTAALGGIPKDYYEAAKIDGANFWTEIVRIRIPLLKPALLYLLVVNTVGSFQVFAPIYLMTSGGPDGATRTIGYLIYENGFKSFAYSIAATQTVLLLVIIFIVALVQFKFLSSDVEY